MKKLFFYALAFVAMATACQKAAPAVDVIPSDNLSEKVAIKFGSNIHTDATKAPVDAWAEQTLYVFGYARTPHTLAAPASLETPYINAVEAIAPAAGTEGAIEVLDPNDGLPFYYLYENNVYTAYNFYACYLGDDATPAFELSANEIKTAYTIDGSQDLMVAYADPAVDTIGTTVPQRYCYSGYSARNGVKPTLKFKHCLTRFDFQVVNCSTTDTQIDLKELTIDSYSEGDLIVATLNAGEETGVVADAESKADFAVPFTPDVEDTYINLPTDKLDEPVKLGSVMVTPFEKHTLNLNFRQFVKLDEETQEPIYKENLETSHVITPADVVLPGETEKGGLDAFKIGYKYLVTVKVYGLEKIEIYVELQPWEDGGSIIVDPDEDPFGEKAND